MVNERWEEADEEEENDGGEDAFVIAVAHEAAQAGPLHPPTPAPTHHHQDIKIYQGIQLHAIFAHVKETTKYIV